MGWIGNVLIVVGLWKIGNRQRSAFLYTLSGEAVWVIYSISLGMWDLAAICIVFAALAVRNYVKWA
jgi:hypothetical protein